MPEIRCDQCGQLPGECVNDYGVPIGNCYTHVWTVEDGLAPDPKEEAAENE